MTRLKNREKNGKFAKGNNASKGRPKGTPNKTTAELRSIVNEIISNNIDNFQYDIDKLDPQQRLEFLYKLLKLILPQQPIEIPEYESPQIIIHIPENFQELPSDESEVDCSR